MCPLSLQRSPELGEGLVHSVKFCGLQKRADPGRRQSLLMLSLSSSGCRLELFRRAPGHADGGSQGLWDLGLSPLLVLICPRASDTW